MKKLRFGIVLMGFAFVGQLHAQPAEPPPAPEAPAASPDANLSGEAMMTRSIEFKAQAQESAQTISHMQAAARIEQDSIKLSCVNDIAIKVKAEQNLLDNQSITLETSLATDQRGTAFATVLATAERIRTLTEQAGACAGRPELTGDFENSMTGPEVQDDPTLSMPFEDNNASGSVVEPPAYASPFN